MVRHHDALYFGEENSAVVSGRHQSINASCCKTCLYQERSKATQAEDGVDLLLVHGGSVTVNDGSLALEQQVAGVEEGPAGNTTQDLH